MCVKNSFQHTETYLGGMTYSFYWLKVDNKPRSLPPIFCLLWLCGFALVVVCLTLQFTLFYSTYLLLVFNVWSHLHIFFFIQLKQKIKFWQLGQTMYGPDYGLSLCVQIRAHAGCFLCQFFFAFPQFLVSIHRNFCSVLQLAAPFWCFCSFFTVPSPIHCFSRCSPLTKIIFGHSNQFYFGPDNKKSCRAPF